MKNALPAFRFRYMLALAVLLAVGTLSVGCSIASTQQVDPFQSGGIGLTRAEWEKNHKPNPSIERTGWEQVVYYPEGHYSLTFWYEGPQNQKPQDARIAEITYITKSPTTESQLVEMLTYLPTDAQLQEKGQITGNIQASGDIWYIYH